MKTGLHKKPFSELIYKTASPSAAVVFHADTRMKSPGILRENVQRLLHEAATDVLRQYPETTAEPFLQKLYNSYHDFNYNTYKKTALLLLSDQAEKIFYLDAALEERVITTPAFSLKDLFCQAKEEKEYLVLVLLDDKIKIYRGEKDKTVKLILHDSFQCGDPSGFLYEKYDTDRMMKRTDESLAIILNAYPLPVFVTGLPEKIRYYREMTGNGFFITHYVPCTYKDITGAIIQKILQPYVSHWHKVRTLFILKKLQKALSENRLVTGLKEIFFTAERKNASLLVIEKGYTPGFRETEGLKLPFKEKYLSRLPFYIKSITDYLVEKTLESGGDILFTEQHVLREYGQIALVKYY